MRGRHLAGRISHGVVPSMGLIGGSISLAVLPKVCSRRSSWVSGHLFRVASFGGYGRTRSGITTIWDGEVMVEDLFGHSGAILAYRVGGGFPAVISYRCHRPILGVSFGERICSEVSIYCHFHFSYEDFETYFLEIIQKFLVQPCLLGENYYPTWWSESLLA